MGDSLIDLNLIIQNIRNLCLIHISASIPAIMAQYRRGLQFNADHEPKFILTPQGRLIEELMKFAGELAKLAEPLE